MRDVSSAAHKKVLNDHDFILRGVAEHYENGLNDLSLVANVVLTYGDNEIVLDGSDYASTLSTLTVSGSLPGQWVDSYSSSDPLFDEINDECLPCGDKKPCSPCGGHWFAEMLSEGKHLCPDDCSPCDNSPCDENPCGKPDGCGCGLISRCVCWLKKLFG